jgi:ABC-type polysaccharide/polyol phosphate export permease
MVSQFGIVFSSICQRANMIASGKMFVANALPGFMLAMFGWNPLFHCIDQARGDNRFVCKTHDKREDGAGTQ